MTTIASAQVNRNARHHKEEHGLTAHVRIAQEVYWGRLYLKPVGFWDYAFLRRKGLQRGARGV